MPVDWDAIWCFVINLLSSESTPAWVQALGSLLALGIAIYASTLPLKHAAKEKRKTTFAIVEATHTRAQSIRKAVEEMDWETGGTAGIYEVYHKSVIDGLVRALPGVPVHELGTSNAVIALLTLTDQLVFLGSAMEQLLLGPHNIPALSKAYDSIDQHDYAQRLEITKMAYSVLKGNAIRHLAQIDRNFESLKASLDC